MPHVIRACCEDLLRNWQEWRIKIRELLRMSEITIFASGRWAIILSPYYALKPSKCNVLVEFAPCSNPAHLSSPVQTSWHSLKGGLQNTRATCAISCAESRILLFLGFSPHGICSPGGRSPSRWATFAGEIPLSLTKSALFLGNRARTLGPIIQLEPTWYSL